MKRAVYWKAFLPMTTITVTATTNGLFKLQGSWLCNDFSSLPQIFALVVYLPKPSLDSWTSTDSALQLYPLISPFFFKTSVHCWKNCVSGMYDYFSM